MKDRQEGALSGAQNRAAERIVREVKEDFSKRQAERRLIERGWELSMNFLAGNQYCGINPAGELEEEEPRYAWQYRRVFNHIAPVVDTRCAKLASMRPALTVRAASDQESDLRTAKISANVLKAVCEENGFDGVIDKATVWSETCGTAFYKVLWDGSAGRKIGERGGENVYEGGVRTSAVSPFEIYPENLGAEGIEEQESIVHARAMHVSEIERLYGVRLAGREIRGSSFAPVSASVHFASGAGMRAENVIKDAELVIERYERPSKGLPEGRLTVVAGDALVYDGPLPYKNGAGGARAFPFVKQCAIELSGSFFGGSIVDRLIPVQRAYNAVKNRKHEFLNRLTMGVLAVEDGSVDTEELVEEGLAPGKVLVYRQGSAAPQMLGADALPSDFCEEEEKLLDEFTLVSGVSEISSSSANGTRITSATGLQLLIDLDDTRLAVTRGSIARAVKEAGRQALRLMREFAGAGRLMRMTGEGGRVEMFYFASSDISSDDVVFEAESANANTPAENRSLLYEIYNMGLLSGEDGKVSSDTKRRVLNALGFGGLQNARGLEQLHCDKAAEENLRLAKEDVAADGYDDHALHIAEHIRYLLSGEFKKCGAGAKERFERHISLHREALAAAERADKKDKEN